MVLVVERLADRGRRGHRSVRRMIPAAVFMTTNADVAFTTVVIATTLAAAVSATSRGRGAVHGPATGLSRSRSGSVPDLWGSTHVVGPGSCWCCEPVGPLPSSPPCSAGGRRRTFATAGFWWFDGLEATRGFYTRACAPRAAYSFFVVANIAVASSAVGPATIAGVATLHDRRLWWIVGPGLAGLLLADLLRLSKAEVERIWLPFYALIAVAVADPLPDLTIDPRRHVGAARTRPGHPSRAHHTLGEHARHRRSRIHRQPRRRPSGRRRPRGGRDRQPDPSAHSTPPTTCATTSTTGSPMCTTSTPGSPLERSGRIAHLAGKVGLVDFGDCLDYVDHNDRGAANGPGGAARTRLVGSIGASPPRWCLRRGSLPLRRGPRAPAWWSPATPALSVATPCRRVDRRECALRTAQRLRGHQAAPGTPGGRLCPAGPGATHTSLRFHNVYGPRMPSDTPAGWRRSSSPNSTPAAPRGLRGQRPS